MFLQVRTSIRKNTQTGGWRQGEDKGSQVQILSARPKTASDLRKRGSGAVVVLRWIGTGP